MSKAGRQSRKAVIYTRVSSKEQEKEGFSIPAQLKLLNAYAADNSLLVGKEFIDVETAKRSGRPGFSEMMNFLKKSLRTSADLYPVVLVEKTFGFIAISRTGSPWMNWISRSILSKRM